MCLGQLPFSWKLGWNSTFLSQASRFRDGGGFRRQLAVRLSEVLDFAEEIELTLNFNCWTCELRLECGAARIPLEFFSSGAGVDMSAAGVAVALFEGEAMEHEERKKEPLFCLLICLPYRPEGKTNGVLLLSLICRPDGEANGFA
jgi:hypothetical protein